jgi:hypothetical protein
LGALPDAEPACWRLVVEKEDVLVLFLLRRFLRVVIRRGARRRGTRKIPERLSSMISSRRVTA